MERLPEELLASICEHCEYSSLKTCRLVNSRFHQASTPKVFEHLYFGLFEHSLGSARSISQSPLAKHVKRLTLYSDIVPSWTKTSWLGAIDFRPAFSIFLAGRTSQVREWNGNGNGNDGGFPSRLYSGNPRREYDALPRHNFSPAELDAGWENYQRIIREQAQWRQDAQGLIFKESISSFPNLTEASVQCTTPRSGRYNTWPLWRSLREKIYVGPEEFIWRHPIDESDYAHQSGQAALLLLEAIGYRSTTTTTTTTTTIKQITTLNIDSSHLDPYFSLMDFNVRPQGRAGSRSHTLLTAFQHLTSLSLHVPHASISLRLSGPSVPLETMRFLRTARQLRKLTLRYGDDDMRPDGESSGLEALFDPSSSQSQQHYQQQHQQQHHHHHQHQHQQTPLWPHLESLSLATNLPAEILVKFLRAHAETLHSLELQDMLIRNVDHAISQIPKILRLKHVHMQCLWDYDDDDDDDDDADDEANNNNEEEEGGGDEEEEGGQGEEEGNEGNFKCVLSRGTDFADAYEVAVKGYLLGRRDVMPKLRRDGAKWAERILAEWMAEAEAEILGGDGHF